MFQDGSESSPKLVADRRDPACDGAASTVLAVGRADQEHRGSARSAAAPERDRPRRTATRALRPAPNESRRPLTGRKIRPADAPPPESDDAATDREFARRGLAGSVRLHPNGFTFL